MIPITINDKSLQIPTTWEDVTFKQYIQFIDLGETELINAVALFTGIKKEVWEKAKEVANFYIILEALGFLEKEAAVTKASNPGKVTIRDKQYKVPKRLEQYTVKQFEDMRGLINRQAKDDKEVTIRIYPKIISVYFVDLIFKEYTVKNIKKTERIIERLPMFDVLGIGNFFFMNLIGLSTGMQKGKQPLGMIVKKRMQAFHKLMRGDS